MDRAKVNGVELEYEVRGAGEPVLLIDMLIADCFVPLLPEPALANRYRLIRYHKRGWVGSTKTPPPVSIGEHAADAAALLEHLGVRCAHVAGHSTGASIGAQLAIDHPEKVHTLTLLEPTLLSLPLGRAFLKAAGPVFEAYESGDHSGAFAMFVTAASGLDWEECRALLEERIPGVVTQTIRDADTFFGVELPALAEWTFGPEQAAAIRTPVLSVIGTATLLLWVEIAELLRSSLPQVEERTIDGVGHLLHIQDPEPVARAMADFLGRNSMAGDNAQRRQLGTPRQPRPAGAH
jgi:pimeloyl-ACP methyl ester carboxylesterase